MTTTILILAGGTGGHILPALAVAKGLQAESVLIHWMGTPNGLENQLLALTQIPIHHIHVKPVRGKGLKRILTAPFQMLRAIWQAYKIIRHLKPTIVIGFGGFVSFPGGIATWLAGKTLFIHEQNAVPGMSNRVLAHLATQVFQAFPNTFSEKYTPITSGNPVRSEILKIAAPQERFGYRNSPNMVHDPITMSSGLSTESNSPLRILILGGSQGAVAINKAVPEALKVLSTRFKVEVWHATGKGSEEKTATAYQQAGMFQDAKIVPFIEDMASAYAWADCVICRAGASTLSEIAAVGLASILIPYPHAMDDHQTKNAGWLVNAGAAILLPESKLNASSLSECLTTLLADKNCLYEMAMAAYKTGIREAAEMIVQICLK